MMRWLGADRARPSQCLARVAVYLKRTSVDRPDTGLLALAPATSAQLAPSIQ